MAEETVIAAEEKAKVGRPTQYKKAYCEQAKKLCLLGATDESLADFFEVSNTTIDTWKKKHPEFVGAIKEGKLVADANVAEALYNRATGYSHPDTHISNFQGEITQTPVTKHYPPDTGAAFIWLKNRSNWKDKQEVEHSGEVTTFNMNYGKKPTDADD